VSKEQVKRFATAARVHRAGLLIAGHCSGTPSCVSAAAIDPNGVIDWMGAHMHAFSRQRRWSPPSAFGLPLSVPQPARYTYSPAAAELGRILFFDKRVSETGSIACASCHDPKLGFSDGHRLGSGIRGQSTRRNTISLLNVAFRPTLRWDSYATPLERFVQYPMSADDEMATHRLDGAAGRVGRLADYRAWFLAAFGTSHVSFEMIAQALATYIRSLVSGGSQFDRAVLGGQHEAMSGSAWRGYALFKGRAGCASCHSYSEESPFFTDSKTHNTGLGWNAAASCYSDVGAGATCASASAGSFRTPTLRDVARTGPYMHDGSIGTLRGVIDYFDGGGGCGPGRDPQLRALHLSEQDKSDLEAFLNALTGATSFDAAGRRRNPQFAAEH
jgi:cytochrome c peroxidase